MTRNAFDALVRKIETRYAGRQPALERCAAGWMALGLAGIVSWLTLLFVLGAAAFALGVVLEPAVGIWLLVGGVLLIVYGIWQAGFFLLVELSPPDGRLLRSGEAPALHAVLESLRRELQGRPVDEVRISMNFNASVREIPRLGLFGWPRTILEIGLPLSMVLSPEELRAVLAHEFAHLSARHGQSGNRLYRVHRTWGNVFEKLQQPTSGRAVRWAIQTFVDWYWPRLHARALVLSRVQEYQADRVAANITDGATLASALWRMQCLSPWLSERFWPGLNQQADRLPEPPADVLARLREALDTPPEPADVARWTERALSQTTGTHETHPAFPERARALAVPVDEFRHISFPKVARPSSAEAFLDADLNSIEQELAAEWRQSAVAAWRERHRLAAAEIGRQTLTEPGSPAPQSKDTIALWETARKAAELQGLASAEPLLRAVLVCDPRHIGASVMLGHHLLNVGDAEGERLLSEVVEQADEAWMSPACEVLQQHYRATGQTDRLRDVRARLDQYDEAIAAARRERATISPRDSFLPHGLSDDQIESLRGLLASQPDCAAAWLARKAVRHFIHRPLFILCVRGKSGRWGIVNPECDRELVNRLVPRVELPGQLLVIAKQGAFRKLANKVMSLPKAAIFRSDGTLPAD